MPSDFLKYDISSRTWTSLLKIKVSQTYFSSSGSIVLNSSHLLVRLFTWIFVCRKTFVFIQWPNNQILFTWWNWNCSSFCSVFVYVVANGEGRLGNLKKVHLDAKIIKGSGVKLSKPRSDWIYSAWLFYNFNSPKIRRDALDFMDKTPTIALWKVSKLSQSFPK